MTPEERAKYLEVEVAEEVRQMSKAARSSATRAVNIMRNSALQILRGERHGRVYKLPGTIGKANKNTTRLAKLSGYKPRKGQSYRASAPGEPPANRSPGGGLRNSWRMYVLGEGIIPGAGGRIVCRLKSDKPYSDYLDEGTRRMKARPYKDRIKDMSMPRIDPMFERL